MNKLSVLIYCPQDKSFLLLLDEERGDYWIPFTDMNNNLSWKDNLEIFKRELFDFEVLDEKLLKIYKIWTLKADILHLIFQINVPKEIKTNCNSKTSIGVVGWYSCSDMVTLRPLLRSLELLELVHIYKPVPYKETKNVNVTGEPVPLGFLTEIRETDVLINEKTCENMDYLNLLDSATLTKSGVNVTKILAQSYLNDVYENYFIHNCPCIYINSVSFNIIMQQYDFCENVKKLFRAADVWKRDFLTFHDFLFLFAVMNPNTPHYGHLAEIRCQYIFRYYNENQDGKLNFYDLKNLISDIELKKNPDISQKNLEKQIECITKSLQFKSNSRITFDQFYNMVVQAKLQNTSLLLRFKRSYCKTSKLKLSGALEQTGPCELFLPFRSSSSYYLDNDRCYSIVLKTTILKPEDPPILLRDLRLLEDTMTKSVLEDFKLSENSDFLKQDSFNLDEKIEKLFYALKYFSTEILDNDICSGECDPDTEYKEAYSWGSCNIDDLAIIFIAMCERIQEILCAEPRLLEIQAPVFVMGDLHGNFHDLMCFEKTLWKNGVALTPAKLLFLGDYVDRGMNGVEVLMYLFGCKIRNPEKLFLIRGNHEMRDIQKIFTFQRECSNTFGETLGMAVWKSANEAFDMMPLAAIIDNKVFCCHGGIPPPWLCPIVSVINSIPKPLVNCERQSPLAWTLMWNDPLKTRYSRNSTLQMELLANDGFVPNLQRGTGFCFNCNALDKFLLTNGLSHVIRAHEVVKAGFQIHQRGKLLTVFSSSNYCGGKNYAGTVLAADKLLRVCMVDTGRKM